MLLYVLSAAPRTNILQERGLKLKQITLRHSKLVVNRLAFASELERS